MPSRLALVFLTAGGALLQVPGLAQDPQAPPLTLDQLFSVSVPTLAALSPDGGRLAYEVAVPEGEWWRVELRVVDLESGLDRVVASGGSPVWSPDGLRLAYAARDDHGRQVWIADSPAAGEPRRLTQAAGGVLEWTWSPDGQQLAFVAPDPATLETTEGPRRYGEGGRRLALYTISANGGEARQLTRERSVYAAPFGGGGSFAYSPDGAQLAFAWQPRDGIEAAYEADLYVVSADGGAIRPLVERPGLDIRPEWSPDGRRLAFTTSFGAVDRFAAHGLAVVASDGSELWDAGRGVEAAFLDAPQGHVWSPDGEALLVEAARGLTHGLLRLDVETGAVVEITGRDRFRTLFTFTEDRSRAAYLGSTPTEPWDVWEIDLARGSERRLTTLNPGAASWRLARWEVVSWRNSLGDELQGLLAVPPGGDVRRPLVTWLHGGPEGQVAAAFDPTVPLAVPAFDPHPLQWLASEGYAVFLPAIRGGAGSGAAARREVQGRMGEALAEDVLTGVAALVERGVADPERLAVVGWASGGTRVAELLSRTTRFRAAIAGAANFDLRAAYGEGDFSVQWRSMMGGSPWTAGEAWDSTSPIRHADRVTTPTLLLHGEADSLVPAAQAIGYYQALRENGIPVELWLYPDEGHGLAARSSREHASSTIRAWLERWLGAP